MAQSFVKFCDTIRLPRNPAQNALIATSFDGADVAPEFADIFGGAIDQPKRASTIVWLCGRASGKTTLGAAAVLWKGLTIDLSMLRPGEIAWGVCVAPDRALATLTLTAINSWLDTTPLGKFVTERTADSVTLKRPDGHVLKIAVFAASRGGSSLRGKPIFAAFLDEACFFRDASAVVNDTDISNAIVYRLLPGGFIHMGSTPWLQAGLVWTLFDEQFGKPTGGGAIVARAKTERMRTDSPELLRSIAEARARDPHTTALESDAEWAVHGTGNAFDTDSLQRAKVEVAPSVTGQVSIGGDLGFVKDASSFAACQEGPNGVVIVLDVMELRPKKGEPLGLTSVMRRAAEFANSYHLNEILVDNHSLAQARDSIEQARLNLRLKSVDESNAGRELRYTSAIQAFKDGRVLIPKHCHALTDQLARIIATPRTGGGHRFSVGRTGGDHADSAMAFLLAAEPIIARLGGGALWRKLAEMKANGESINGESNQQMIARLSPGMNRGGWTPWQP
ncbi:MAG: hypothetical protein ABI548_23425 [Polyangiaceae bacterium]